MNQPHDSAAAPGPQPDPAVGESGASSGTGAQAQPHFGDPGQAYPGYPQPGYGTPPGYGQPYQAYGQRAAGKDPALAEWWRRLFARVIDGLILVLIFSPLWIPPWRTFLRTLTALANQYPGTGLSTVPAARSAVATAESHLIGKLFAVGLAFYLVAFLYDWVQHWRWGQTIGKRVLRTKVVKADGNPAVGAGPACGRAAIYALSPLVPLVGWLFDLVNELWLTWDPRRQCLHDRAAHTVVIKKDYQLSRQQGGAW